MEYLPKIEGLSEPEIQEIILGKEEGRHIEFKSDVKFDTNDDKKEFLYDLSSFTNASGGDLMLGVIEKNGIAESINGIAIENPDKFKQRIENLVRDCVEPTIPALKFQIVKLSSDRYVVVISIKESFNKPHAVNISKNLRVYSRNSTGKYPLDVYDLRNLILGSEKVYENIRKFREQRIFAIMNQDLPVKFENEDSAKFIIHIIPHQSFFQNLNTDFNEVRKWTDLIQPLTSSYFQQRLNFDGVFSYVTGMNFNVITKYFQLYRNGIIESVNAEFTSKHFNVERGIWGSLIGDGTIALVNQAIEIYKRLEVSTPIYVLVTLLGLKDHCMILDPSKFGWAGNRLFDRDKMICPEVVINDYNADLKSEFQFIFDMIWNSAGFDRAYE